MQQREEFEKPKREYDPRVLRRLRTGSVGAILFIAPLLYFALFESFTWVGLLTYTFGGIIIFTTMTVLLATKETRTSCKEHVFEQNPEIEESENIVNENAKKIRPYSRLAAKTIQKHNIEMQKTYDEIKTNKIIEVKQRKLSRLEIKAATLGENKTDKIERKIKKLKLVIAQLQKAPKHDWRFKPYKVERLVSNESISKYKPIGDKEISVNPTKLPIAKTALITPFKGFLGSAAFVIPIITLDAKQVLQYYAVYSLIMLWTILSQYVTTKLKILYDYTSALDKKKSLQEMVIGEIKIYEEELKESKQYMTEDDNLVLEKIDDDYYIASRKDSDFKAQGTSFKNAYENLIKRETFEHHISDLLLTLFNTNKITVDKPYIDRLSKELEDEDVIIKTLSNNSYEIELNPIEIIKLKEDSK